jgi:hypothetical protein
MVPLCMHTVATTPAGPMKTVRSYCFISFSLPRNLGGSAPASPFSRPAQRSLTLRPARSPSRHSDPLHRRLRRLCYLRRRSDCYRVERTAPGRDFHSLWTTAFSRRTKLLQVTNSNTWVAPQAARFWCDQLALRTGVRFSGDKGTVCTTNPPPVAPAASSCPIRKTLRVCTALRKIPCST